MKVKFLDLKPQFNDLKEGINASIQTVLNHGMFVNGPEVKELESQLCKFSSSPHSIACSSGTDALVLALLSIDIKPGDEVITTAFSFIATAESIALCGAVPVFVDIDPETYNLNPDEVKKAVSPKTKAIMPVSLFGQPAQMDEINTIAKENNLIVIEDAAQSYGATYKGKISGNLSTIACTSFFPAKPLGCYGDGGAVFTNDPKLDEKIRIIRDHGQTERYKHEFIGINGRMDSMQCGILLEKLKRYPDELKKRQSLAKKYSDSFTKINADGFKFPKVLDGLISSWAQYTLSVPNREDFREKMMAVGVPTAVHYPITMSDQPAYKSIGRRLDLTHAGHAAKHVVSLPMYPDMPEEETHYVIDQITNYFK